MTASIESIAWAMVHGAVAQAQGLALKTSILADTVSAIFGEDVCHCVTVGDAHDTLTDICRQARSCAVAHNAHVQSTGIGTMVVPDNVGGSPKAIRTAFGKALKTKGKDYQVSLESILKISGETSSTAKAFRLWSESFAPVAESPVSGQSGDAIVDQVRAALSQAELDNVIGLTETMGPDIRAIYAAFGLSEDQHISAIIPLYESAKADYQSALAENNQLRAELAQARFELAQARDALAQTSKPKARKPKAATA